MYTLYVLQQIDILVFIKGWNWQCWKLLYSAINNTHIMKITFNILCKKLYISFSPFLEIVNGQLPIIKIARLAFSLVRFFPPIKTCHKDSKTCQLLNCCRLFFLVNLNTESQNDIRNILILYLPSYQLPLLVYVFIFQIYSTTCILNI